MMDVTTHPQGCSPTLGALAAALAKAQSDIQPAAKDKTNPAFRSRYADLASVWDACRAPLTKAGLSVVQLPVDVGEDRAGLRTLLLHSSGEWIETLVSARLTKADAQGLGSALTYLRRYSLSALVGVAPDDDDGNAAAGRGDDRGRFEEPPPRKDPPRQDGAPKGEHHPSWTADRARFCASLGEQRLTYELVADYCTATHRPRPSSMDIEARRKFWSEVITGPGRADLDAFVAAQR
jgi:hypothetical protein